MGLQRPEQTTVDSPAVINDTQTMEDYLQKVLNQCVEHTADDLSTIKDNTQIVDSLEKLSSDDKVSSTNLPKIAMKIPIPSTVSAPIATVSNLCVVFNKEQTERISQYKAMLTINKRAYKCSFYHEHGHTKIHCPALLSGGQLVVPAKELLPGNYIIYHHPAISKQRNIAYSACVLTEQPMELYSGLSSNLSTVEHTLFQPIIDDEIDEENTTRIPPNNSPTSKTKSSIISRTGLVMQLKPSLVKDMNYDTTDEVFTTNL